MSFECDNEIEIGGGSAADRLKAAALFLAADSADEDSASREEGGTAGPEPFLALRFRSVDGLPEEELASIAAQFPDLSFLLVYFSLDAEFYGYAKAGAGVDAAESDDFADDTRDIVGMRHDGDGIAFVKARYSLPRAGE